MPVTVLESLSRVLPYEGACGSGARLPDCPQQGQGGSHPAAEGARPRALQRVSAAAASGMPLCTDSSPFHGVNVTRRLALLRPSWNSGRACLEQPVPHSSQPSFCSPQHLPLPALLCTSREARNPSHPDRFPAAGPGPSRPPSTHTPSRASSRRRCRCRWCSAARRRPPLHCRW